MPPLPALIRPLPFALACCAAAAQSSWSVGPGAPFADVQAAIAAASPGDEIVVAPGTYGTISLDRGVTIRARFPGTVTLTTPWLHWIAIPPGQTAHLLGLELEATVGSGRVVCEHCVFEDQNSPLVVFQAELFLQNCVVRALAAPLSAGDVAALHATDSLVCATGSEFLAAIQNPSGPRPAVRLAGASRLRGSHLRVLGDLAAPPLPALLADPGCSVWLSDSAVHAAPGGLAVDPPPERRARCDVSGPGLHATGDRMPGVRVLAPLAAGQPFGLALTTYPGGLLLVFRSDALADLPTPLVAPELLLAPAWLAPEAVLFADAAGNAAVQWQLPAVALPPGTSLWWQVFDADGLPVAAAPPVGGLVRP